MATNNSINNKLGNNLVVQSNGSVTMPSQPCFLVYPTASISSNVTGDGTTYTIPCDGIIFDTTSSYNGTYFVAPTNGNYLISGCVTLAAGTAIGATSFVIRVIADQVSYTPIAINANAITTAFGFAQNFSVIVPMDIADLVSFNVTVSGLVGKTTGITGGTPLVTWFSGALLN